jgi:hypothetical protein
VQQVQEAPGMIRTNANKALNTTAGRAADRLRLSRANRKTKKD